MKLEDMVCSLELAKKLKEFGVKQDSLFYWSWQKHEDGSAGAVLTDYAMYRPDRRPLKDFGCVKYYSAFTVAELGEMLPDCIEGTKGLNLDKFQNKWLYFYGDACDDKVFLDTEADARAQMLIRLIEEGLVKKC